MYLMDKKYSKVYKIHFAQYNINRGNNNYNIFKKPLVNLLSFFCQSLANNTKSLVYRYYVLLQLLSLNSTNPIKNLLVNGYSFFSCTKPNGCQSYLDIFKGNNFKQVIKSGKNNFGQKIILKRCHIQLFKMFVIRKLLNLKIAKKYL